MVEIISLDYVRRARRFFRIYVEQIGLGHFIEFEFAGCPRIAEAAFREGVELAVDWMERRTANRPNGTTVDIIEREFKRVLLEAMARRLVRVGY